MGHESVKQETIKRETMKRETIERETAKQNTIKQEVICSCARSSHSPEDQFILCQRCSSLQHSACALSSEAMKHPTRNRCNDCKQAAMHHHMAVQRQKIEVLGKIVEGIAAEGQNLYPSALWKHYCNLPNGRSSDAVLAVTQTTYSEGAMVPVHSAPQSWIDEVLSGFAKITQDASEDVVAFYIGFDRAEGFSDLNDLRQWRDLARWMLHGGPYKRRKDELGILAEVLGFVERGTFWNGT